MGRRLHALHRGCGLVAAIGALLAMLAFGVGSVFGVFTFILFTFYLSADGPRLRLYLASLFPHQLQTIVTTVWDTTATKTGNYGTNFLQRA